MLRERSPSETATWDQIIKNCLEGTTFELDEEGVRELLAITGDAERLTELMTTIEGRSSGAGNVSSKTAALMRMLRDIVGIVSKNKPDELDPTLRNMATAMGALSPDSLMALIAERNDQEEDDPQLISAVVEPHVGSNHREVRVAKRHQRRRGHRSARAGVSDAGSRHR